MALVELQSSRVATTKISKCNAMPLVRVSLAFQHNSTLGQKKGYERFTFCQHCKKNTPHISLHPLPYKKDGFLKDNWEKRREMAEQQVPTKWCLFWGSGSKHSSKIHTQKKIEIKHPGKIYLPTKCRGAAKSRLMKEAPPFWRDKILLAPIHFVGFLQGPAVYSYT